MPRKIVARQGPTFHLIDYDPPPLGERDVRVAVEFAAPKHGTEIKGLTSNPFARKRWDPELRLFLPNDSVKSPAPSPERSVGNMIVGTVAEVGSDVSRFQTGDRVFGYGPICDLHQTTADRLYPLGDLQAADAVCVDPAHVAFVAIRDGNVRIGDDVVIYGLGAIGLMAVQIARAAGRATCLWRGSDIHSASVCRSQRSRCSLRPAGLRRSAGDQAGNGKGRRRRRAGHIGQQPSIARRHPRHPPVRYGCGRRFRPP